MTETSETKPPVWFWVVSTLAVIWNAMGVGAYLADTMMSEDAVALLTEAERTARDARPAWFIGAFAIAVFAGTLGCLALLMRRRWAAAVLAVSLVAVLLQQVYFFLLSDVGSSLTSAELGMTIMIPIVGALLIWLARVASARQWLS